MVLDKKHAFIPIISALVTSYLLLNTLLVKSTKTPRDHIINSSVQHEILSVYTLAGGGVIGGKGALGDGEDGLKARLNSPQGIVVDLIGNVYIADVGNSRIRKLDTYGIITTIAGNGSSGFSGDGGKATLASLNKASDVSVDSYGNLYIADTGNSSIRRVDTKGIITTIAGNGKSGFSGDEGKAILASLNKPQAISIDQEGSIYIVDTGNSRIRMVNSKGIITTIAGNEESGFSGDGGRATLASLNKPLDIALDVSGAFYILDNGNERVRHVSRNGVIRTVAGNGNRKPFIDGIKATESSIDRAVGICTDSYGFLYIADSYNYRVRRVGKDGIISTIAGDGRSELLLDGMVVKSAIGRPRGVTTDQKGNLYFIAENLLLRMGTNRIITVIAGNGERNFWGDGDNATHASLFYPSGTEVDSAGNIYIVDSANHRIRKVDENGIITTVVGSGKRGFSKDGTSAIEAALDYPRDIAFDSKQYMYVSDCYNNVVRRVDKYIETVAGSGKRGFSGDMGKAVYARLNRPNGIDIDSDGNLYIADTYNNRIRKVDINGIITTVAGNGRAGFEGDGENAQNANLRHPRGVSVYRGEIFIADTGNHRIRKVDAQGVITTVAGNGTSGFSGDAGKAKKSQLNWPYSILHVGEYMYISDSGNNCIRKVDQRGIISTIAVGEKDKKPFIETPHALDYPKGIATDSEGKLYIAEWKKHRLTVIDIF